MNSPTEPQKNKQESAQELVLDLNFVPQWARKPAGENPFTDYEGRRGREDRGRASKRRSGPPRGARPGARGGGNVRKPGPNYAGGVRPERQNRRSAQDGESSHAAHDRRPRDTRRPPFVRLPFRITFVPDKKQLGAVVRQLRHSHRAYPIGEIAHLLMSKPAYFLVKFEAHPPSASSNSQTTPSLYQCTSCNEVFRDESQACNHILAQHLSEVYDSEEISVDPPTGQFVVVARCRKSGILLGPPNHHSYNDKLRELHASRFKHLPFDAFLKQIETIRDPEQIEAWKEQVSHKTVFFLKDTREPEGGLTKAEAEAAFMEGPGANMLHRQHRMLVPGVVAAEFKDQDLKRAVQAAWHREQDRPLFMPRALKPAFRHMGLHVFKAGGQVFVTAVKPYPVDPAHAADFLQEVLSFLERHPGSTRVQMLEALRPGKDSEAPEVHEILQALHWLVEKGGVIEFFNGMLSVPGQNK